MVGAMLFNASDSEDRFKFVRDLFTRTVTAVGTGKTRLGRGVRVAYAKAGWLSEQPQTVAVTLRVFHGFLIGLSISHAPRELRNIHNKGAVLVDRGSPVISNDGDSTGCMLTVRSSGYAPVASNGRRP